uniref:Uncharacterized protein n=1 Tax=Leersia perrieri TaxID=77586 RepID=A0A0D9WCX1_9ORYZ
MLLKSYFSRKCYKNNMILTLGILGNLLTSLVSTISFTLSTRDTNLGHFGSNNNESSVPHSVSSAEFTEGTSFPLVTWSLSNISTAEVPFPKVFFLLFFLSPFAFSPLAWEFSAELPASFSPPACGFSIELSVSITAIATVASHARISLNLSKELYTPRKTDTAFESIITLSSIPFKSSISTLPVSFSRSSTSSIFPAQSLVRATLSLSIACSGLASCVARATNASSLHSPVSTASLFPNFTGALSSMRTLACSTRTASRNIPFTVGTLVKDAASDPPAPPTSLDPNKSILTSAATSASSLAERPSPEVGTSKAATSPRAASHDSAATASTTRTSGEAQQSIAAANATATGAEAAATAASSREAGGSAAVRSSDAARRVAVAAVTSADEESPAVRSSLLRSTAAAARDSGGERARSRSGEGVSCGEGPSVESLCCAEASMEGSARPRERA